MIKMGIMDKVLFWKQKDELGIRDDLGLAQPHMPADDLGLPASDYGQQPQFGQQQQVGQSAQQQMESIESSKSYTSNKDLEVISAKLDAIKATIESINQRLASLERMAGTEEQEPPAPRKREWY